MSDLTMWFVISVAFLVLLMAVLLSAVVLRLCKGLVESLQPVLIRQLELLDKATTIAAASDMQAYQGIQVMNGHAAVGYDGDTYDPSDAAEAEREAVRRGENPEELNYAEQEALRDILAG